jgi:NAD(P)H dehydrogenase (quinone)
LKNVLVICYSKDGKTKRMAEYICESMCGPKVEAKAIKVEDFKVADLSKPDGLVIGSPTYFSNMAWQMKKLVDESICFYGAEKSLEGKVGGCFTSAGCRTDGLECLRLLELAFGFHHKMKLVPGLISDEDDKEDKLKKVCNEFGKKIAEQINLK